jgi:hypothetical protein
MLQLRLSCMFRLLPELIETATVRFVEENFRHCSVPFSPDKRPSHRFHPHMQAVEVDNRLGTGSQRRAVCFREKAPHGRGTSPKHESIRKGGRQIIVKHRQRIIDRYVGPGDPTGTGKGNGDVTINRGDALDARPA